MRRCAAQHHCWTAAAAAIGAVARLAPRRLGSPARCRGERVAKTVKWRKCCWKGRQAEVKVGRESSKDGQVERMLLEGTTGSGTGWTRALGHT